MSKGTATVDIAVVSDTHLRHDEVATGAGDLLIHCGDMFNLGKMPGRMPQVDAWFAAQDFAHIVCIGGNHDHELERFRRTRRQPFAHALYLKDAEATLCGLSIYGTPWVPDLPGHAFYADEATLARKWAAIPAGIDILITHTPPFGILDRSSRGRSHGCPILRRELARIRPRVHCFGHVHAAAGSIVIDGTTFINASALVSGSDRVRPPIRIKLEPRDS